MALLTFLEDSLPQKELKKVEEALIISALSEICPIKIIEDRAFSLEKPKSIQKE